MNGGLGRMCRGLLRARSFKALVALYQLLPLSLRARFSRAYWHLIARQLRFPPLPQRPVPANGDLSKPLVPVPPSSFGVNIFGFFSGQFGLGESARLYATALTASGTRVAVNDIDIDLPHSKQEFSLLPGQLTGVPFSVDLIVINPDYLAAVLPRLGDTDTRRYRIAVWFWELETIPTTWLWALDEVDEIMVASRFVQEAVQKVTTKPVFKVPLPIGSLPDSGATRRDFGLSDNDFIFLVTFDFHSSIHRKYPEAAIKAFQAAFPSDRSNVRLLLKSSNGFRYPAQLSAILEHSRLDPRIVVRDQVLAPEHIGALQRCADAYVSLHRAEGFGLGIAECMARAKPVIATAWSGNMEFMTPSSSCLVDYKLVEVNPSEYHDVEMAHWAEPDILHAASYMRRLVEEPDYRTSLGVRAVARIREVLSAELVAALVSARLACIGPPLESGLGTREQLENRH